MTPEVRVLTENKYDDAGRLLTVKKKLNDAGTPKQIVQNSYDALGRLATKELGNNLETLNYEYNVHGWLRGINRDYANGSGSHYFGMELDYDYGFSQPQYNGNIAGERWRTSGDGARRAYGFSYDLASRLTKADFRQYTSGSWNLNANVDYSVSNLAYDANGNIKSMTQKGLITTTSAPVDNMTYHYRNSELSNQLDYVAESGGTTAALGDFKDGHTGAGDYAYDSSGNLTKDLNKAIAGISYNQLNLPETITVTGKGTIQFVYDAIGNKLRKIVTDNTDSQYPNKKTITDYIGGFIYQNDTLQFFGTEEGRVRTLIKSGSPVTYTYDYFVRDHLGNIRVVLTEQTDFTTYLATMEPPNSETENALFANVDNTREAKPMDYPEDNTTSPNTAVAKLNGSDPDKRVGPSLVLRVMAGDTIEAAVRAFYRQQATTQNNVGVPAEEMAVSLMQALNLPVQAVAGTHEVSPQARLAAPRQRLTSSNLNDLKEKDPNNKRENKPKAYLNYVFFDNQFNFVEDGSGVKQVDAEPNALETLASGKVVAKENGYVYVYTSNESSQDVLFDNFGVTDITGPVLEETHYYPYGLIMAGISRIAPLKLESRYKFNGIEINHKEFSDESGLDLYSAYFRNLDPQIGRWWQIDPRYSDDVSPYASMDLNPALLSDILGDTTLPVENGLPTAELPEITVIASKTFKNRFIGFVNDLAGNGFEDNPWDAGDFGWSRNELRKAARWELTAAGFMMGGGELYTGVKAGLQTLGWKTLGRAGLDAGLQLSANYLQNHDLTQSIANINVTQSLLAGLNVNYVSASITSSAFQFNFNRGFVSTLNGKLNTAEFLTQTGMGMGFGYLGGAIGNYAQSIGGRSLPIGLYMSSSLSVGQRIGFATGLSAYYGLHYALPLGLEFSNNYLTN